MAEQRVTPGVRRSRSALSPDADVEVRMGGRQFRAVILDVSLSGLRVLRPHGLQPAVGDTAELAFPLDAEAPLVLRGSTVRVGDDQLAFHFAALDPGREDALRALIGRRGQPWDGCGD